MTKYAGDLWQGKLVLVTGGSTGLGWFIAQAFAQRGAKIIVTGRDEQRLNGAAQRLVSEGHDVVPIAGDVTQTADLERLFQTIREQHGQLHVLVNNAGRSDRGEVMETTVDEFRQLMEINFFALVRCSQHAMGDLVASRGHLINIGSLGAKTVSPFMGAYPASKFPVAAYTQQLRMELESRGLHVLLVCPGPVALPDSGDRYEKLAAQKHLPESAGKPGGGVHLKGIDPARLASQIVRACEKRSPEIVVPGRARWLFAVSALWPRLGDWIVRRMTK